MARRLANQGPVVHNARRGLFFCPWLHVTDSGSPARRSRRAWTGRASAAAAPLADVSPGDAEAVSAAYEATRARPADADATGALAMLLHAWEQWDAAHELYARAAILAPRDFAWRYLDACVLERLARPSEEADRLTQALGIQPDYLPARVKLAGVLLDARQLEDSRTLFTALLTGAAGRTGGAVRARPD